MSSARLLPGEQRRPTYKPSVEEANNTSSSSTARSVRSIRQRFEAQVMTPSPIPPVTTPKTTSGILGVASPAASAATNALSKTTSPSSAPSTPAKKRPAKPTARPQQQQQTKTQAQLAAFLRERASSNSQHSTGESNQRESVTVDVSPSNVCSLIEKWSSASSVPRQYYADRNPLQERHLQRPHDHHPPHPQQYQTATGSTVADSVDTFGSSSVDFDQIIPKTDPGRLESYAAHARMLTTKQQQHQLGGQHPAIQHPATGDQSLKEMMTRGIAPQPQHQSHLKSQTSQHPHVANDNSSSRIHVQAEPRHHDLRSESNPAPGSNPSNIQNRIEQFMQMTQTEVVVQVKQTHTTIRSESNLRNESNLDINELTDPSPPPSHHSQHPEFELSSISPASDETTIAEAVLEGEVDEHPETTLQPHQPTGSTQSQPASDWGAGDVYIRELFSEAEETAERAVQCDENEEYFEAFELYWVVVDLYSKVIPFLSQAEGVDVHERIKMYTRRCQAIREAFEDDVEDGEEDNRGNNEDSNKLQNTASRNTSNGHDNISDSDNADLVHPFSNVRITGADTIPRNPAEVVGRVQSNDPLPVEKKNTRPLAMDQMAQTNDQATQHVKQSQNERQKIIPETVEQGEPSANGELRRTPFPDFSERPMANIPDASEQARPRPPFLVTGTGPSAATQAHRSSLSRPISRSAARASTNSVSKEKVAEMQERVNLMQECLNNFTVKQKHLGPARALELAVTTLNANTFGDLKKLEPLAPELEHKWATELGVLLSMLKEIKVVRPGIGYALREDIAKHLPALERCDRSVRKTMRSFGALSGHVRYVERETASSGSAKGGRGRRRWWVKVPVVDHGGLNNDVLKIVEEAEQEMRSVFKICHEINVEVVKTIPVPISFVEGLPKHARSLIHKELKEGLTTWGMFKVSDYMKDRKMWDKESAKEITSSLEKVALIWEARTSNKSFLSRTFDIRGERFHQAMTAFRRCQNAIRDLRREWPTMQHTELDMAKIQHNEDIGLAGLESYSRALESRAYRLLTRIRELLEANAQAKEEGNTS